MSLDPQINIIGTVTGSITDRLSARTVDQARRQEALSRAQPTLWTPLPYANGWADYGNVYRRGAYRRLADGTVELRGLLAKPGGTWIADETMFVLPAGFAPIAEGDTAREIMHPMMESTTLAYNVGRIDALASGNVVLIIADVPNNVGYVNLNGLRFSTY